MNQVYIKSNRIDIKKLRLDINSKLDEPIEINQIFTRGLIETEEIIEIIFNFMGAVAFDVIKNIVTNVIMSVLEQSTLKDNLIKIFLKGKERNASAELNEEQIDKIIDEVIEDYLKR